MWKMIRSKRFGTAKLFLIATAVQLIGPVSGSVLLRVLTLVRCSEARGEAIRRSWSDPLPQLSPVGDEMTRATRSERDRPR